MFDLQNDINMALASYPTLKQSSWRGKPIIAGVFPAHNKAMDIEIDTYEIRIDFTAQYPYAFPLVTETGNKIQPRNATRHIFQEGYVCLGNEFDEARVCKNGISLKWFLDEIVNPHLCREYVKETTGDYPTGERSHGEEGLWESFYDIFETTDKAEVLAGLDIILVQNPGRNDPCPCGTSIKYKYCHWRRSSSVLEVGIDNAQKFYNRLKKHYNEINK